jgi:hypothetical protein
MVLKVNAEKVNLRNSAGCGLKLVSIFDVG